LLLHTDRALFASTSRQVSEGSLPSQQLPSPAGLLVAGRVEGDLGLNPRGGAIMVFACGKAHDPRWLLRAVQLRQELLLLLWLAGLTLVAFAYR
jgi:hypothetical protein